MTAGDKLGPYEILGPLGQGGMGEVWKARDPRLNRIVAIKQSHIRFSERFEREAHAIAALNHPHICQIYDVGPDYLVMEYVEGQPLKGPVPLNEALTIAGQILDALDAAHRKGITHRDLKPDNILVGKAGVKILDFGLAKMEQPDSGVSSDVIATKPLTAEGTVLGTLHYMSPEQIEGQEADARSDIFAFGLVLYELITGKRAFEGKTRTSLVASILKDQPRPLSELQPLSPPALERVVATCLEKDPDKRWQSAREVKHALEWISSEAPGPRASAPAASTKRWLWPSIAAVAVVIAGITAYALWPKHPAPVKVTRFQVPLPENSTFGQYLSLSPDGRKLLFNTTGPDGGLWVRDLDSLEARLIPGTQGVFRMFWSPDSRFVAFGLGKQLKKMDIAGGPVQTLCEISSTVGSGAWNRDGVIIFGSVPGPIRRVPEAGGVPTDVTAVAGGPLQTIPSFLPDGHHFIYYRTGTAETTGMYVGSIDAKPADQSRKLLLATQFAALYATSPDASSGHVFFLRDGTLMAQSFDSVKLELSGDPVPIAEHVGNGQAHGFFSVSPSGALAYRTGVQAAGRQLTWFDRDGKTLGTFGEPNLDRYISLSPDGTHGAVRDAAASANGDLWTLDFARGVRTRFTFRQSFGSPAVWSPDGNRIIFAAGNTLDTISEKASSGAGEEKELLKKPGEMKVPSSWSRDKRFLLYDTANVPKTGEDLWVLPLEGERKPVLLLGTEFNESDGSFSPDMRWIAYDSNESGRYEIYVRPFNSYGSSGPSLGEGKWQVSKDGGSAPEWRADGKELVFRASNGSPMAVEVGTNGAAFQPGVPKQLFALPLNVNDWDMTADGKRFLISMPPKQESTNTPITVVLNWQAELKK
jgi:serine/threonine protein kinase/Tol biopolymer transport system component